MSLLLFILEDVFHIDEIDGYQVFAHNQNEMNISNAIDKIVTMKQPRIEIKLSPIERKFVRNFEEKCIRFFEENFETLAKEAPLILPCKEPKKLNIVVQTMYDWCKKTNKLSGIKGLILHSFSIAQHLEHFGFTREALRENLQVEASLEESVIVVYNPQKNVLLLIRNAENQDLETEIKFGFDYLKMFILLFNEKLKGSNMKLIALVVTTKENVLKLKCVNCSNNVLSLETFKDLLTFEKFWDEKTTYFGKENLDHINHDFIKIFLAKITGTVAATLIFGEYLPTMTDKCDEQMKNVAVLLTRQQMEVLHSKHKYIIIKGGFGCGKTIVAAAMLKKISDRLKNDEKLYYICYDSRSELLDQIRKDAQRSDATNVTPFHNEEKQNLSVIINNILEENENTKKINFVVDEYDGEDLDRPEAINLNNIFNDPLKQIFILLIVQPIEKKRVIDKNKQERNRFDLLQNMQLYSLTRVMRNSVEIYNLISLTADILGKQKTIFIHQKGGNVKSKVKTDQLEPVKHALKESSLHSSDINTRRSRQADSHEYHKEYSSVPELELDQAHTVSKSMLRVGDEVVTTWTKFRNTVAVFFGFSGNKTISKFLYATTDGTGHKISTEKPALFELGSKSDFQKVVSLIAIFEKQEIRRGEHVVLHFDTATNEIPSTFFFVFSRHFGIQEKLTNKYEAFQSPEKSILVCSYPTFRGLEHPNITVIIDRDIYYEQHYLVETLARCTTNLNIIVLQNNSTLKNLTAKWKTQQVIQQWKIKICEDAAEVEDFGFELKTSGTCQIMNVKFKCEYSKKLKKEFEELVTEDKISQSKKEHRARIVLQQR